MPFLLFQNKKIAYQSQGQGTSVIFVHGFCEDHTIWEDFNPEIIAAGYRVITVDLPGFGESEVVPDASVETMATIVNELLSYLDIEKAVFIGHSLGGYVGLAFAKTYTARLLGLGLFHSHPYADSEEKKQGRRRSMEVVRSKGGALFVRQLIPGLFAESFARSHPDLMEQLIRRAAAYPPEGILNALQAMHDRPDQSDVLKNIQQPVLFIIGKEDTAVPKEASLKQTTLPDMSSVVILEGVGHMGMFEAKAQTQQAVVEFLRWCTQAS
jgi:pimeloyl-ACP methyl ester carboxylesterase